ncbi:MAG: response regulator [Bacteroidetes bacterium]|nr:response regulator [Bacteroidota bacterium]HET6245330.1 response regulator [Bacteroidia bacterium]
MAKVNILVVEDESIVSKDIQHSLKKLGYNVVGATATGEEAVTLAEDTNPDIVLMDIMLKGEMSGIDAALKIKEKFSIPIIYLTAYADESTLNKAKITEPYAYILKPFKEIDLHTSIEMALFKHKKQVELKKERDFLYSIVEGKDSANIIFVKSNLKLVKLRTEEIYYVEALKDYVVINTIKARYTIHSTMKQMQQKLGSDFVRVHRSYIVRIDKISTIEQNNLIVEDNKKIIPIGGSYKDELSIRLNTI